MSENLLNEKTVEDLLGYDTATLLAFDLAQVNQLLDRAIHDQEEILKKAPKKKTDPQIVNLSGKGVAKAKRAALETRDMIAKLPPEFASLMADVQKTISEANKLVSDKDKIKQ